jgi:hypothetical protein
MDWNVIGFIQRVLFASLLEEPLDPGLTEDEILELGHRMGFAPGELRDALQHGRRDERFLDDFATRRVTLSSSIVQALDSWSEVEDGDPRNAEAFDYVLQFFIDLRRQVGEQQAATTRDAIVLRGSAERRFSPKTLQGAITLLIASDVVKESGGLLRAYVTHTWAVQQRQQARPINDSRRVPYSKLLPELRDILARRASQRPPSADPLALFQAELGTMGKAYFSEWWHHTAKELALASDVNQPTTVCVLSAALSEGSLSLVVETAQASALTLSKNIDGSKPTQWRFETLLKDAKSGSRPILDEPLFQRGIRLNDLRQRIHAGRIIAEPQKYPRPDARPEEAEEARQTLKQIVRAVLDWLADLRKNPPIT